MVGIKIDVARIRALGILRTLPKSKKRKILERAEKEKWTDRRLVEFLNKY